jgi:ABC-type multidrug transport system fused ATPase/permease subunit
MIDPPKTPDEDSLILNYEQESVPPPSIEFRGISFNHDGISVLEELDISISPGDILALRG